MISRFYKTDDRLRNSGRFPTLAHKHMNNEDLNQPGRKCSIYIQSHLQLLIG